MPTPARSPLLCTIYLQCKADPASLTTRPRPCVSGSHSTQDGTTTTPARSCGTHGRTTHDQLDHHPLLHASRARRLSLRLFELNPATVQVTISPHFHRLNRQLSFMVRAMTPRAGSVAILGVLATILLPATTLGQYSVLSPADQIRLDALALEQARENAKYHAEMRAFKEKLLRTAPLPAARNPLLGRWRVVPKPGAARRTISRSCSTFSATRGAPCADCSSVKTASPSSWEVRSL